MNICIRASNKYNSMNLQQMIQLRSKYQIDHGNGDGKLEAWAVSTQQCWTMWGSIII